MDEQKNNAPAENKPEKKLSRTTLTFYIVGLFSVAIALILISYVAQARADRQVENLSSQLNEQQTVAQGATQKVADLQQQFDLQSSALESVRSTLGTEQATTDVVGATQQRMDERDVYSLLASIYASLYSDNYDDAKRLYDDLTSTYDEERLLGNAEQGSFPSDVNKLYEALKRDMENMQQSEQTDASDAAAK